MTSQTTRLGIIGCGAVTELFHLPAARLAWEIRVVALADKDLSRARHLGRRFGIGRCVTDYHEVVREVDGMIVAVPNHLHAPISRDLLGLGIPVLVEKPLAPTVDEARALVSLARASRLVLQVGHMYRFSEAARLVKRALDEGWLGALQGFSLRYGVITSWPATSGFYWKKEQAGGGVLLDLGTHMLDLLLWWLGAPAEVEYRDDALGGVEADCNLSLTINTPSGSVRGEVALSRLRRLGTAARIIGEQFTIQCDLRTLETRLWPTAWGGDDMHFVAFSDTAPRGSFRRMFAEQLRAFSRAIHEGTPRAADGEAALATLALIDRCYHERKPLETPWLRPVRFTQA